MSNNYHAGVLCNIFKLISKQITASESVSVNTTCKIQHAKYIDIQIYNHFVIAYITRDIICKPILFISA